MEFGIYIHSASITILTIFGGDIWRQYMNQLVN